MPKTLKNAPKADQGVNIKKNHQDTPWQLSPCLLVNGLLALQVHVLGGEAPVSTWGEVGPLFFFESVEQLLCQSYQVRIYMQVQLQSGLWQDYAIKEKMVNYFRCELVSTNVTRLRPTTSCSRDQVVKSSFWKLQSCQMWSLSSSKVEVCGPGACPLVKGQTQCRKEKKAVIQQVAHHHHQRPHLLYHCYRTIIIKMLCSFHQHVLVANNPGIKIITTLAGTWGKVFP